MKRVSAHAIAVLCAAIVLGGVIGSRRRRCRIRSRRFRSLASTRRPAKSAAPCSRASSRSGNGVLWGEAGVGVVATQAIVDVSYGPKGLALLRAGMAPEAIIKAIWESDPDPRPGELDQAGPAVRRHRRQGQHRRVHGPESLDVGRPSAGQVLHRAGQHPRRRSRSSPTWSRRSKRRPATCRCG